MKKILIIFVISAFGFLNAQDVALTGNINQDSKLLIEKYNKEVVVKNIIPPQKKSAVLAGIMSAVVPGAGEYYTGYWVKGLVFTTIEAAAIAIGVVYNNRGNNQTNDFQNYADKNWSVVRYAQWLIDYEKGDKNIIISNDPNRPPWEQINWDLLNASEVGSHKLPHHGDQQYYEMIGKYFQFSAGWDDYSNGPNNSEISAHFNDYSHLRGKANNSYDVAAKAVIVIYANHFLSIIDAVWSSHLANNKLSMKMKLENQNVGYNYEYVPTLHMSFNF